MHQISTHLFKPRTGSLEALLFANPYIGLGPTLFYNITIPLEPFDPGLELEPGPLETEFRLDFLELHESDWRKLDGQSFTLSDEQSDCSIYIGGGHCPVDVLLLTFTLTGEARFHISAQLRCLFEEEGVGKNAEVSLDTDLEFSGLVMDIPQDSTNIDGSNRGAIRNFLGLFVELDAYDPEIQIGSNTRPDLSRPSLVLKPSRR